MGLKVGGWWVGPVVLVDTHEARRCHNGAAGPEKKRRRWRGRRSEAQERRCPGFYKTETVAAATASLPFGIILSRYP
ncbi:hypothetical protein BO71DRAFT_123771 [Aspergillus ellipticus CBS 707.79]|uniref:Uncharacterized protein n=1 Tax=Aspergillus ellipticus CBS 707.79 TaxID=1448320 RepID=A0A319CUJ6_9EURO|nr:hypothetical protein BO71DRAFT_123771 [Aspergillus ellipticus CBS 707.79]